MKKEGVERSFVRGKSAYLLHRPSTNEDNKFRVCASSQAHSVALIKSRKIPRLSLLTRDCGCARFVTSCEYTRKIFSRKSTQRQRKKRSILVGRDHVLRVTHGHGKKPRKLMYTYIPQQGKGDSCDATFV